MEKGDFPGFSKHPKNFSLLLFETCRSLWNFGCNSVIFNVEESKNNHIYFVIEWKNWKKKRDDRWKKKNGEKWSNNRSRIYTQLSPFSTILDNIGSTYSFYKSLH